MDTVCKPCKKPSRVCQNENCNKYSSYNFETETKGIYCAAHALPNMMDVIHLKCIQQNCNKRPNYNFESKKQPLYCNMHKLDSMIDIENKKCIEPNCNKRPNYNYINETSSLYCKLHSKENMICVTTKKCIEPKCIIQSSFNFEGELNGIYCKLHSKKNMICVTTKKCIEENCKITASFNYINEKKPLYCSTHKHKNMQDVRHVMCLSGVCGVVVSHKNYQGYCLFCFINLFPDKPVARNYKTKEKVVSDFIKENFKNMDWIIDKKVFDGCSKRRPDLFLDLGYQVIIIEIDENQHESYEEICENKRTMIVSQDLGFRPIIFIRFNPDDYTIDDKKITSCWGLNGNGIMTIKKSKKKEWSERLQKLKETVTYWLTNTSDKNIEIVHLYFSLKELKN